MGKGFNKMQIYLCEDVKAHMGQLSEVLEECAYKCKIDAQITCFTNAEDLLCDLRKKKETGEHFPILLFSDIELPGMSGVELGKILKREMPQICIVFMTAYEQYAIEGYETGAMRYLLKPPAKDDVTKILLEITEIQNREKHIIIKNTKEEICVSVNDILYISAEDKYLVVHTKSQKLLTRGSLQDYEEMLEQCGFFRVHRKYLVNLRHHKSITNGSITLSNEAVVPISRRKESAYRSAFMKYIEGGLLQ